MKLAIIGSHGVGKSTLTREISEKYNLDLLPEIATSVFERDFLPFLEQEVIGGYINKDEANIGTLLREYTDQYLFFQERLLEEELGRKVPHNSVSDRTSLDILAYSFLYVPPENDEEIQRLIKIVMKDISSKYTHIFYKNIAFPMPGKDSEGGNILRDQSEVERRRIDFILRGILSSNLPEIPIYELYATTIKQNMKIIEEILNL